MVQKAKVAPKQENSSNIKLTNAVADKSGREKKKCC